MRLVHGHADGGDWSTWTRRGAHRASSWAACALLASLLGACPGGGAGGAPDAGEDDGRLPEGVSHFECTADQDCAFIGSGPCDRVICHPELGLCQVVGRPADCGERVCGEDPCGHACGACPAGEICSLAGSCIVDGPCGLIGDAGCCTAAGDLLRCDGGELQGGQCGANVCGWESQHRKYACTGFATASGQPALPHLCPGETCEAVCATRECGWDCGEACGQCPAGSVCSRTGACLPCAALGLEGCCDGDDMYYCFDGVVKGATCGNGCGWNPNADYYECGYAGEDPSGKWPRDCAAVVAKWEGGPGPAEPGPEPAPEAAPEPAPDGAEADAGPTE